MRRTILAAVALSALLGGCSLAGDTTPPPELATAQAAQPLPTVGTEAPTPTAAALSAETPTAGATAPAGTTPTTTGSVRGKVINATPGGTVPAGLEVTLHGFDGEQEVLTQSAKLAADGTFEFKDLAAPSGRIYGVTVEYDGVLYYSEGAHLTDTSAPLDLSVTIYDTTTQDTAIRVDRLHMLYNFVTSDQVQVIELWVLSNLGDHTVVAPAGGGSVRITLPEGATDLQFEDGSVGERYTLTQAGFVDAQPVIPGKSTSQLVFSFVLPYKGKLDFRQPTNYAIDAVVAVLPEGGVTLKGDGVQDMGVREISGQSLRTFGANGAAAGGSVNLTLSGRPKTTLASGTAFSTTNLVIGLAVLGILLIVAGLWWFRKPRARPATVEAESARGREALLRSIALLDDDFDAGRVPEAEYRRQREALKRELLEWTDRSDD